MLTRNAAAAAAAAARRGRKATGVQKLRAGEARRIRPVGDLLSPQAILAKEFTNRGAPPSGGVTATRIRPTS